MYVCTPTKFYPCHSCKSGGEAEEPDAEGGLEGKNKKPGLLGGGPLAVGTPFQLKFGWRSHWVFLKVS